MSPPIHSSSFFLAGTLVVRVSTRRTGATSDPKAIFSASNQTNIHALSAAAYYDAPQQHRDGSFLFHLNRINHHNNSLAYLLVRPIEHKNTRAGGQSNPPQPSKSTQTIIPMKHWMEAGAGGTTRKKTARTLETNQLHRKGHDKKSKTLKMKPAY